MSREAIRIVNLRDWEILEDDETARLLDPASKVSTVCRCLIV